MENCSGVLLYGEYIDILNDNSGKGCWAFTCKDSSDAEIAWEYIEQIMENFHNTADDFYRFSFEEKNETIDYYKKQFEKKYGSESFALMWTFIKMAVFCAVDSGMNVFINSIVKSPNAVFGRFASKKSKSGLDITSYGFSTIELAKIVNQTLNEIFSPHYRILDNLCDCRRQIHNMKCALNNPRYDDKLRYQQRLNDSEIKLKSIMDDNSMSVYSENEIEMIRKQVSDFEQKVKEKDRDEINRVLIDIQSCIDDGSLMIMDISLVSNCVFSNFE